MNMIHGIDIYSTKITMYNKCYNTMKTMKIMNRGGCVGDADEHDVARYKVSNNIF